METIKLINDWGFQIMFLVLCCASSVWAIAAAVTGVRWALSKLAKAVKSDKTPPTSPTL